MGPREKKLHFPCLIFIDFPEVYLDAGQVYELGGLFDENMAAAARRSGDIDGLKEENECGSVQFRFGHSLMCVLEVKNEQNECLSQVRCVCV